MSIKIDHKDLLFIFLLLFFSNSAYAWKISAGTVSMNDPGATPGF
ncbi:MAG: hypothetical protein O7D86_01365 [Proteobacteria bacterium]|nr:hypothetical protein [Pseudomonadota bacterium]